MTVLALSACADLGVGSLDPFTADEAETTAETAAPAVSDGAEDPGSDEQAADGAADTVASAAETTLPTPGNPAEAAAVANAPHVYMALQPETGGMTSVVFAIDRSRDNTPSDEPAIRITPEATDTDRGRCNPQQLRYYKFPPESARQPVYGPDEAARGVFPKDLPGFMATAVSSEMMAKGIAEDLEQTRPQNVCTRKLFEQTIVAANTGQG